MCLDLQVIDNIPGAKVEEDTETHHVLAENLYKPRRRVTHSQIGTYKPIQRRTQKQTNSCVIVLCVVVLQYQSHYSRHFMPVGEKERQDREVFQRNMKSRMETFKSTRHKRHKKERSLKKVNPTHRHQAPSDPIKHHPKLSISVRHRQKTTDTFRHLQIPSDTVRQRQIPSDTVRYHQTPSDTVRHLRITSDTVRHHVIPSVNIRDCRTPSHTIRHHQTQSVRHCQKQ